MVQYQSLSSLHSGRRTNCMPVHTYTNWNKRQSDAEKQLKPYRKYFFICEGANTETFYFQKLIDLRKELGIHPLIDICLWQKTGEDKDISYAKKLVEFAMKQKDEEKNGFDKNIDKVVVVFDADVFEEKVQGYDELIEQIEKSDIAAITNPGFELFLLLFFYCLLYIPFSTKRPSAGVHITMGCTAAGSTRCRLRTSCYDKLYFLYKIRFLKSFFLRRLCIIF